ncbi:hypothetical protein V6N13_024188 [Hibiscus sabdariffa]|uniref:Uncharacterized protein n=1 Tax=Hibiscus sabdariffa TaxID=183260 RepID=A0ABR2BWY5_9ROSI
MENLNFTEEEYGFLVTEHALIEEEPGSEHWLVGSVVSFKDVNGESLSRIFKSVWKAKNVAAIIELRQISLSLKSSTVRPKE